MNIPSSVALLFYQNKTLAHVKAGEKTCRFFRASGITLAEQQADAVTDTAPMATDRLGSILHTHSVRGDHYNCYTAYGHRSGVGSRDSLLGFNAERLDPQLDAYLLGNGYRAFNTRLMRFQSADTLSPFGDGSLNAYSYCSADPINYSDPSGHVRIGWPIRHSSRSTPQLAHFSQRRFDTAPSRLGAFEIRGVVEIMPTLNKYLSHDDLVSLARTSSGMRDLVQGASRQLANTIDRNNLLEYSGLLTNAELQRKLPGVLRSDYENKIGELSRQVAAQAAKAHRAIQIDSLARGFHAFNTDTGRRRALRDLRGTGVTMKLDALSRTFAVRHSL